MSARLARIARVAFPVVLALAAAVPLARSDGAAATDARQAERGGEAIAAMVDAILVLDGDAAYGAYLGGECVTCHRASGAAPGIPPIAGLPRDYFVLALVEYRTGLRDNKVMQTTSARLSDAEIAALAAHFAAGD